MWKPLFLPARPSLSALQLPSCLFGLISYMFTEFLWCWPLATLYNTGQPFPCLRIFKLIMYPLLKMLFSRHSHVLPPFTQMSPSLVYLKLQLPFGIFWYFLSSSCFTLFPGAYLNLTLNDIFDISLFNYLSSSKNCTIYKAEVCVFPQGCLAASVSLTEGN